MKYYLRCYLIKNYDKIKKICKNATTIVIIYNTYNNDINNKNTKK